MIYLFVVELYFLVISGRAGVDALFMV